MKRVNIPKYFVHSPSFLMFKAVSPVPKEPNTMHCELINHQPVEPHRAQRHFAGQLRDHPRTDRGYSPPLGSGDWLGQLDLWREQWEKDTVKSKHHTSHTPDSIGLFKAQCTKCL